MFQTLPSALNSSFALASSSWRRYFHTCFCWFAIFFWHLIWQMKICAWSRPATKQFWVWDGCGGIAGTPYFLLPTKGRSHKSGITEHCSQHVRRRRRHQLYQLGAPSPLLPYQGVAQCFLIPSPISLLIGRGFFSHLKPSDLIKSQNANSLIKVSWLAHLIQQNSSWGVSSCKRAETEQSSVL